MSLKLFYYLCFSIVAVGCYHWVREWVQESFSYYFSFSRVKDTDKLFELVEKSIQEEKETTGLEIPIEKEEEEKGGNREEAEAGEEVKEEVEKENEEDLFHFIDGL